MWPMGLLFVIPVLVTFFVCSVSFIIKKVTNVPFTMLKIALLYLIDHKHLF